MPRKCRRTGLQILQALLFIQFQQSLDKFFHVALDDMVEVEVFFAPAFTAQPMVGATVLREIVGADALRAIS